jgi:hypothetical protein
VPCLFFRHFLGNQTEINENLNKNYKIQSKQTNKQKKNLGMLSLEASFEEEEEQTIRGRVEVPLKKAKRFAFSLKEVQKIRVLEESSLGGEVGERK